MAYSSHIFWWRFFVALRNVIPVIFVYQYSIRFFIWCFFHLNFRSVLLLPSFSDNKWAVLIIRSVGMRTSIIRTRSTCMSAMLLFIGKCLNWHLGRCGPFL